MSVYVSSENKLVTCPYDEAHKVKESRLQLHIAKCKLNHLDLDKRICPFNATHLLTKGEYDHHLINCPDRGVLDRQLAQTVNKNNPYKGRTDVPHYSDPFITEESWEIDQTPTHHFNPPPPGAVIEPPAMAKPAERKRLYQEMFQFPKENDNIKQQPPAPVPPPVLRQPKQPSAMQSMDNIGMGRGKPTSRIAANIFPKSSEQVSHQAPSYSRVLCRDMGNLSLGRAKPANSGPAPVYNDNDFPALGSGRGALTKPKQSPRTPGSKSGK